MPALPNVAKVIRVQLFGTSNGNTRVQDRIFFQYSGAGPSTADLATFLNTVATSWGANLSSQQNASTSLNSVQGTDLTSLTSPQTVISTSKVGTGVGAFNPNGSAAVVKFRLARRYRGGHPRFYLPGPPSSAQGANGWTAAYIASLASGFQAFINGAVLAPPASFGAITHVNVSYFQGFTVSAPVGRRARNIPSLRPGGPVVDLVLSYAVNPLFASQRRRNQQSP